MGVSGAFAASSTVVLVFLLASMAHADWMAECPQECVCKWISGKKAAICSGVLLTAIPKLSSDIQFLNLTENTIESLGEHAIARAGVPHVQKLYLSKCKIHEVDRTAFAELGNMVELDLSHNMIHNLHPSTFKGLKRLRKLVLSGNPLVKLSAHQFPRLGALTHLDLSECRLKSVDPQAFMNLKEVEVINLSGNQLQSLSRKPFMPLKMLKSLGLFDNPWKCDCRLKDLREWLIDTKLYALPTACSQPDRLHGKTWDTLGEPDFACKPDITAPRDVVIGTRGENVTLSCRFVADPPVRAHWNIDGRMLHNNSQIPFSDQVYVMHEEGDVDKWLNLTITNVDEQDAGEYRCVGVNEGGMAERNVSLRFELAEAAVSPKNLSSQFLAIIIASVVAVVVFSCVLIFICLCVRRRRSGKRDRKSPQNGSSKKQNGTLVSHHSTGSSIVGISPMRPAPLTRDSGCAYEKIPDVETRIGDDEKSFDDEFYMKNGRGLVGGVGGGGTMMKGYNGESSSRSTRTPETASLHSDHPPSLYNDASANFPDLLNIAQTRKFSSPASMYAEWAPPSQMSYVTLPRRPRASWSHPVNPSTVPAFTYIPDAESSPKIRLDPVYDNLGPRTTADGTLRRPSTSSTSSSVSHRNGRSQQQPMGRGDYYADIPDFADHAAARRGFQYSTLPRSTPNVSEAQIPMTHQNYRLPPVREESHGPADGRPSSVQNLRRNHVQNQTTRLQQALIEEQAALTQELMNGLEDSDGDFDLPPPPESVMNDDVKTMKKVPPKPPPKPSKLSTLSRDSSITVDNFQDEGDDGTEI